MFHKHLKQGSKRYKEHPNVAALSVSLPKDKAKAKGPEPEVFPPSPAHLPKIRDFANEPPDDQHHNDDDPALSTAALLAAFTESGFRSRYRRVNNGDLLSQAGVPGYEKIPNPRPSPSPDAPVDPLQNETRPPPDDDQAQDEPPSTSSSSAPPPEEMSRVDSGSSSDVSDTTTAAGVDSALVPLIAKTDKDKDKDKKKKKKRKRNKDDKENQKYNRRHNWGFRDRRVITAVAACLMDYMH